MGSSMRSTLLLKVCLSFLLLPNLAIDYFFARAQQSAAGQDTLIGVVGPDYVMIGADSSSSGGIALTSSNIDKIAVIHDGGGHGIHRKRQLVETYLRENDRFDINGILNEQSLDQQAITVAFAGDTADADRLVGALKAHTQIREYEAGIGNDVTCVFDVQCDSLSRMFSTGAKSPSGMDAEAVANLARSEIASRLRSRQPLQLCLLVGGMVRCNNPREMSPKMEISSPFSERVKKQVIAGSASYSRGKRDNLNEEIESSLDTNALTSKSDLNPFMNPFLEPKMFWLDQYGSLQNVRYGSHGYGSNFAFSILDQKYRSGMSREDAVGLIRECFDQLRKRYVINSPRPPRIKCIDAFGVTEVTEG